MKNEELVKIYMDLNKVLLASIHLENKTVYTFDGENNYNFSYIEFFQFMAKKFNLAPAFINKALLILESLDSSNEFLEIVAEYYDNDGHPNTFVYHILSQKKNELLVSIRKSNNDFGPKDQITKSVSKAYIDNIVKYNILAKSPFLLIYVDIDNFTKINVEYGQAFGDRVLIEMVSACNDFIGNKGFISRVVGDRFLIFYEISNDYDEVHSFVFNLKIKMQNITSAISRGIAITVTIGAVRFPYDGNEYELLLKKCEKALIRGKNKGRDCFVIYLVEKTGPVTADDEIKAIDKIDAVSTKDNVYSLITSVNQTLSTENSFDEALDKAIASIGNYFYIDRVTIARINIKTGKIIKHHAWFNHKTSSRFNVYCIDEIIPIWAEALGNKKFLKIDDTQKLDKNHPLVNIFPIDHTSSSLAFELLVNNRSYGLIRFDMTTGPRHWPGELFQIMLLLSQLISSNIQKNYLSQQNSEIMYYDSKHGVYNFLKFFKDSGEYLLNNPIEKFSIVEFDARNIVKYIMTIGDKKIHQLVLDIMDCLVPYYDELIYGKRPNGPFVIFFMHQDKEKIELIIEKIGQLIHKFSIETHTNDISLQAGGYLADLKADGLELSIERASTTRSLNKTNHLIWYSDEINRNEMFINEMVSRVDEAILNNEFIINLQPKISTIDLSLIGAEALSRWNYKKEKILSPNQFINIFEEKGIIDKLDFYVFEEICKYQKNLIIKNKKLVPVSVNVSRYISDYVNYINHIEKIRNKYDIPAKYIEIEITEGMYYENSSLISNFIDLLHEKGYLVAMDDFGAGYSNLVGLAKLNFDIIKFDKSFCSDLNNENVKSTITQLLYLVKSMNMTTICEGVENAEDVQFLANTGCDAIQGFYFSKPISMDEFLNKYYK